uniref:G-protein coupled receptors family 1 profile domain-containing protein n=1 Tax=Monopterus albus TaxID=43700 RepID=A0A3Q3JQD7_MONAL
FTNLCLSTRQLETLQDKVVPRDENLAKVEIAPLSTVFISAALLNIALLLILWRQRMSRMRVCPQLMWDITDRFLGPDLVCRLVKYLQVLGMFSSIYMIVVITFDKYEAECNPMVKFQRTRTRLNIPLLGCHRFSFSHRSRLHPAMGLRTYITWTNMVIFCFTCYCTCRLPSAHLPSHPDQPSQRCGWHVQGQGSRQSKSLLAGATFVPCVLFGYTFPKKFNARRCLNYDWFVVLRHFTHLEAGLGLHKHFLPFQ